MDTLPLPPRPNLDQYRKRAKSLVAAAQSDRSERRPPLGGRMARVARRSARRRALRVRSTQYGSSGHAHRRSGWRPNAARRADGFTLADAQFLIAEAHGFENWATFARHVGGDSELDRARRRIRARRRRDRERRSRDAHGTRHGQSDVDSRALEPRPPRHAAALRRRQRRRGLSPKDAEERRGDHAIPARRRRRARRTRRYVRRRHPADHDESARVERASGRRGTPVGDRRGAARLRRRGERRGRRRIAAHDGAALRIHRSRRNARAPRRARRRPSSTAAALGRLDQVRDMVVDAKTLKPGVPLVSTLWTKLPPDPRVHIELALAWACKFARPESPCSSSTSA